MVVLSRIGAVVALLTFLLPVSAHAQRQSMSALQKRALTPAGQGSHWELTAFNGIYLAKDLYQAGGARLGIHDSYTYGGRLAYHPSVKLGVELSYARTHAPLEARSGDTGFANPAPFGELVVQQADLGAVITQEAQPGAKATGFLLVGAGATRFGSDIEASEGNPASTRLAWHVGIGTKIKAGDKLALRIEGRYRSTNTDRKGEVVYKDVNGNPYSFAPHWYRTGEVTAGLTYRVGG
jgi:opacity protein-like surface antigen